MDAGKERETLLERIIIVSLEMQEMESEYLFLPLVYVRKTCQIKKGVLVLLKPRGVSLQ